MTVVLKVDPGNPDRQALRRAAEAIRKGELVAFPTETVYGLGADFFNKEAVENLYKVKKRPRDKPFAVLIAGSAVIKKMGCEITKEAALLMKSFWPGPLTMVLKARSGERIGFRMPADDIALSLLKECATPLAAPSANISGSTPPRSAPDVLKELDGKIAVLLDAGKTKLGVESTVVDMTITPPKILREGAISISEINGVLGK